MTLEESMIPFEGERFLFLFQKLRKGIRLFRRIGKLKVWRGIPDHSDILLCLGPLGTRYFSPPLSAKLRDTRSEPSFVSEIRVPTSHSRKKSVRCQKRNCSSSADEARKQTGASHPGVTFSLTNVTNHARRNRRGRPVIRFSTTMAWRNRQEVEREIGQIIGDR